MPSQKSFLNWVDDESRVVRPATPESLDEAARAWPAQRVLEWLFFYVPQVFTYQDHIAVSPTGGRFDRSCS